MPTEAQIRTAIQILHPHFVKRMGVGLCDSFYRQLIIPVLVGVEHVRDLEESLKKVNPELEIVPIIGPPMHDEPS